MTLSQHDEYVLVTCRNTFKKELSRSVIKLLQRSFSSDDDIVGPTPFVTSHYVRTANPGRISVEPFDGQDSENVALWQAREATGANEGNS